jgi:hypothetical protein
MSGRHQDRFDLTARVDFRAPGLRCEMDRRALLLGPTPQSRCAGEHFCRRDFEGRTGELRRCETGPMIRDLKSRMQMQGKVIQFMDRQQVVFPP